VDRTAEKRLRQSGLSVRRGEYIEGFLFDAVVDRSHEISAVEVLSFATGARKLERRNQPQERRPRILSVQFCSLPYEGMPDRAVPAVRRRRPPLPASSTCWP
jgi:hypothetical protein